MIKKVDHEKSYPKYIIYFTQKKLMKEQELTLGEKIEGWIKEELNNYNDKKKNEYILSKEEKKIELEKESERLKLAKAPKLQINEVNFKVERLGTEIRLYKNEKRDLEILQKYMKEKGAFKWDYSSNIPKEKDPSTKDDFYAGKIDLYKKVFSPEELAWIEYGLPKFFSWGPEYNSQAKHKYSTVTKEYYRDGETRRTTDSVSLDEKNRVMKYSGTFLEGRQQTMVEKIYAKFFIDRMRRLRSMTKKEQPLNFLINEPNHLHMTKFKTGREIVGNHSEDPIDLEKLSFRMFLFFGASRTIKFYKYGQRMATNKVATTTEKITETKGINLESGDFLLMHPGSEMFLTYSFPENTNVTKTSFFLIFRTLTKYSQTGSKPNKKTRTMIMDQNDENGNISDEPSMSMPSEIKKIFENMSAPSKIDPLSQKRGRAICLFYFMTHGIRGSYLKEEDLKRYFGRYMEYKTGQGNLTDNDFSLLTRIKQLAEDILRTDEGVGYNDDDESYNNDSEENDNDHFDQKKYDEFQEKINKEAALLEKETGIWELRKQMESGTLEEEELRAEFVKHIDEYLSQNREAKLEDVGRDLQQCGYYCDEYYLNQVYREALEQHNKYKRKTSNFNTKKVNSMHKREDQAINRIVDEFEERRRITKYIISKEKATLDNLSIVELQKLLKKLYK